MIAVMFELKPEEGFKEAYLDLAKDLRPLLEEIKGFISVECFQSLNDPDKILSLSFFEDEEALSHWRNLEEHRTAQKKGREELFAHYRLRVAAVIRDYAMEEREQTPKDSKTFHLS